MAQAEDTPEALASAKQVQRARIALLEHHTSQMQGYKYYILTLVLGIFAVLDFWSRTPSLTISVPGVNLDSATVASILLGFIFGAIFYSFAKFVCYGQTVGATTQAPIFPWDPRKQERTLMQWLDKCISDRALRQPRLPPNELLYQLGLPKRHPHLLGVCVMVWLVVIFLRFSWWGQLMLLGYVMTLVFTLVFVFRVQDC
jgi:hypothetical protein